METGVRIEKVARIKEKVEIGSKIREKIDGESGNLK